MAPSEANVLLATLPQYAGAHDGSKPPFVSSLGGAAAVDAVAAAAAICTADVAHAASRLHESVRTVLSKLIFCTEPN